MVSPIPRPGAPVEATAVDTIHVSSSLLPYMIVYHGWRRAPTRPVLDILPSQWNTFIS